MDNKPGGIYETHEINIPIPELEEDPAPSNRLQKLFDIKGLENDIEVLKVERRHLLEENNLLDLEYHKMLEAVRSANDGIKHLRRKLEVRDDYVNEAEDFFNTMQQDSSRSLDLKALFVNHVGLQAARMNLGLVKRPKPEHLTIEEDSNELLTICWGEKTLF